MTAALRNNVPSKISLKGNSMTRSSTNNKAAGSQDHQVIMFIVKYL